MDHNHNKIKQKDQCSESNHVQECPRAPTVKKGAATQLKESDSADILCPDDVGPEGTETGMGEGSSDGPSDGSSDGPSVGPDVGPEGMSEGAWLGPLLGLTDGGADGAADGLGDGPEGMTEGTGLGAAEGPGAKHESNSKVMQAYIPASYHSPAVALS